MPPKIEYRPISTLTPYARNARTHSAEQIEQLVTLLQEFGWTNAILVDQDGIIAGHGRQQAAQRIYNSGGRLRWPGGEAIPEGMVPVVDCTGWSEAQRRAYILADNKSALNAGWNDALLSLELHALEESGYNLELTAFSADELSHLMFDAVLEEDEETKEPSMVVQYNIIFDDQAQQDVFFGFVKWLKGNYPDGATIGERLTQFITEGGYGQD